MIRTGRRSGLPVIVAVHSTVLGQAVGGCRLWHYPDWRDGLADALRLSAGMTYKCAVAGLANGGGKTVLAVPEGVVLDSSRRRSALHDVGDAIAALGGRYATGPDVGTGPPDMTVIAERTGHVFCQPPERHGSGDSSPHTAAGVLCALRALCLRTHGTPELTARRLAVVGLGHVGAHLAGALGSLGAELVLSDVDPAKRALAGALGATWAEPDDALTAEVDVLVPAAVGGVLTADLVPHLRCAAVLGPANNQLADDQVADQLHERGIVWVPDYVVSAGGVVHALAVELHDATSEQALARVRGIGDTVGALLDLAERSGVPPARAAHELAHRRLAAAAGPRAAIDT